MAAESGTARVRASGYASDGSRRRTYARNDEAFASIAEFLGAFMWQADAETLEITFVTKGVKDLTGRPASAWLGELDHWTSLIDADDRAEVVECLRALVTDGRDRHFECRVEARDGRVVWLRHAVRMIDDGAGGEELWGVATDVTSDKIAEAEIRASRERNKVLTEQAAEFRRRSLHDPLTGLPNRLLFDDRLSAALRVAERTGVALAVLQLDLDRFKDINDTYGHHVGDVVLKHMALRLKIALRSQDTPARLGGDEFAGVLPNTDAEGAMRAAQRVISSFDEPVVAEGHRLPLGVSLGVALYPGDGGDAEALLGNADAAMYRAKASGGGYALWSGADGAVRQIGGRVRRRRARRRQAMSRRVVQGLLGLAAALTLLAGAMVPVARGIANDDSASRLTFAATELAHASPTDVPEVVDDVEDALVGISWKEASRREVTRTLDRLHGILSELRSSVPDRVDHQVERVLATIEKVQTIAKVDRPVSADEVAPPGVGSRTTR